MILYHVTTRPDEPFCKRFVPRIPRSAAPMEDHTMPRVCFAREIRLAIQAAGYRVEPGDRIGVYELDTDGFDPKDLIDPYELSESDMVYDAERNQEWWLLVPVTLYRTDYVVNEIDMVYDPSSDMALVEYVQLRECPDEQRMNPGA